MKRIVILIAVLTHLIYLSSFAQGYEIKVKVRGVNPKQPLYLGHHFNEKLIPDDTVIVDSKGWATFTGLKPLPGGMYFIFLPSRSYFDFLVDKQQRFIIENDTLNLLQNLKFTNSPENTVFNEFQKFMVSMQKKAKELQEERAKYSSDPAKAKEIEAKLIQIDADYQAYVTKVLETNNDMFFTKFIKATRDVSIPKHITDDFQKYLYYKAHYWDNFDVSDARLLRTPIYENKIMFYLDKVSSQVPDSLNKEVDYLIEKSRSSQELFRYMLVSLFNKYAGSQIMSAENVYVHIADKYYIKEADWSEADFLKDLKERVRKKKNCLIDGKAKDMKLQTLFSDTLQINMLEDMLPDFKKKGLDIEKDSIKLGKEKMLNQKAIILDEYMSNFKGYMSLHQTKSKFTILWFWDPTCSHCMVETPKLHTAWRDTLKAKGVNVIAVFLHKDLDQWDKFVKNLDDWYKFIKKNKLNDWTNAWSPFDPFRENYDISSSPVLFLLDENLKIIAKRVGYEQAKEIIEGILENEEQMKKKK